MPVDDLEVLIRQLDGALLKRVHVQVLIPVRVAGRGEKRNVVSEATARNFMSLT
jgi:hypothetical protein